MRLSLVLALWLAPAVAAAYPQFQPSLESHCGACHVSPAGGGPLTAYGRDAATDTISAAGSARLPQPSWLALGANVRAALGARYVSHASDLLASPEQAELSMRIGGEHVGAYATVGHTERMTSREHFIAYEGEAMYARAGRFFPVFGLRLADHTAYVNREMGRGLNEEPYGIELAQYGEDTELHATAFMPAPEALASGLRTTGIAALVEHRFGGGYRSVGAQGRVAIGEGVERYTLGGITKLALGSLLVVGELDVQGERFRVGGAHGSRPQLAGYFGVSAWARRGVLVGSALHYWNPDLLLPGSSRQAADVTLQVFPYARFEVQLLGRVTAQAALEAPGLLGLVELHAYL